MKILTLLLLATALLSSARAESYDQYRRTHGGNNNDIPYGLRHCSASPGDDDATAYNDFQAWRDWDSWSYRNPENPYVFGSEAYHRYQQEHNFLGHLDVGH
jgi:hypothetical protein